MGKQSVDSSAAPTSEVGAVRRGVLAVRVVRMG